MNPARRRRNLRGARLGLCAAAIALGLATGAGCGKGASTVQSTVAAPAPPPVEFNRDIRPILVQNCILCHGGVRTLGNISFVFRADATRAGESGHVTIKPGDADQSELMARITTRDPEKRMPPVDHGHALEPRQIELFRRWINEGAHWSEHWAFVAPKPQRVPKLDGAGAARARNPIDNFIIDRLAREGLSLSPEAGGVELLRRVFLDLTGLPPTPAETDAFLADQSPGAYERQVGRLLDSPRFGERWASLWMDLARYADTSGFEKDPARPMWRYRDWLVDALNRNLPYDRFVIEQIAGDLLPNATLEQLEATAFHRNTLSNDEGGIDSEEFRMLAVQDRAMTTWAVFNGVTYNCVQCHSHPYDPIRHDEYYSFLAFFNTTSDANYSTSYYPTLRIPDDPARDGEALRLQTEILSLRSELVATGKALGGEPGMWRPLPIAAATADPSVTFELKGGEAFAVGTVKDSARYDLVADAPPGALTAVRIEVSPLDGARARHTPEPGFIVSRIEAAVVHPGGAEEPVAWESFWGDSSNLPAADPNDNSAASLKAAREKYRALSEKELKALPEDEQANARELLKPQPPPAYSDLPPGGFAADPSLFGTRWIVGVPALPLQLEPGDRLRIRLVHHGAEINSRPAVVRRVRVLAAGDPRWSRLTLETNAQEKWRRINGDRDQLLSIPGTPLPIMRELPAGERRETLVFHRGNMMDKEGAPLQPDVPSIFPPLPKDAPRNRLTLARWLVAPGQPLTARIAVNRFWEQLFGLGLVETLEDFGSVGQPPSHPELLDWLALNFQDDLHWDVKALLRELVTSSTYRQTARITPVLLARDPRNRLLSRGPRNRLTAEMVRDNALVAGGLLSTKMGGPPVMPPQPAGVWSVVYNDPEKQAWVDATGDDRYRRALYTYWRRTSPYPSFLTFDVPMRDVCTARRVPTNTPLQALVTLNDPVYMEAAQAIARRMRAEGGATVRDQIAFGFRLGATRGPSDAELKALLALYGNALTLYQENAGDLKAGGFADAGQAALTAVASAILNLDAVLTK